MKRLAIILMLLFATTAFAVYAAPDEATVILVGGGTKANSSATNGGGATLTAWNTSGDPTDFTGVNGGPITADTGCAYDGTITITKGGIGTGVTVGTLAHITGTNITTGIYEVTAQTDDTLAFADIDAGASNTDTVINVGGAINTLSIAINSPANDAATINRYVYINDETITTTINVSTNTGSTGTRLNILGYNATFTAEAMAEIDTETELADGLVKIADVAKYYVWRNITFNGGGKDATRAVNCVSYSGSSCYEHRWTNCDFTGASGDGFKEDAPRNAFENCKFYLNGDGGYFSLANGNYARLTGCSFYSNYTHGFYTHSIYVAISDSIAYDNGIDDTTGAGFYFENGAQSTFIKNCTAYSNYKSGFHWASPAACLVYNNTSVFNGDYGFYFTQPAQYNTITFSNNHAYNNDQNAGIAAGGDYSNKTTSAAEFQALVSGNNRTGDPLFTDAPTDFTPLTGSDLINNALQFGGTGTLDIGAIQEASPSASTGGQHSTKQGGKQ